MKNSFKIFIIIVIVFFIIARCSSGTIVHENDILAIKVYKASFKINTDTFPIYKEITEKKDINRLVSTLNRGEKNRYILLIPDYYVEILYKDTIVEIFINDKYFGITTTYETSVNLSKMIDDL